MCKEQFHQLADCVWAGAVLLGVSQMRCLQLSSAEEPHLDRSQTWNIKTKVAGAAASQSCFDLSRADKSRLFWQLPGACVSDKSFSWVPGQVPAASTFPLPTSGLSSSGPQAPSQPDSCRVDDGEGLV